MGSKNKSAKTGFNNLEEAKAKLTQVKDDLEVQVGERKAYATEFKLKSKEDHSEDPKHGKKWKAFLTAEEKLRKERDQIKEWMSGNKPAKEKKERNLKYEYPVDCTSDNDKKKYRAKMRAAANKEEKGETKKAKSKEGKTEEKKDKSGKKDKAGKEEGKKDKKSKKKED